MNGRLGAKQLFAKTPQSVYVCGRTKASVVTINIVNKGTQDAKLRLSIGDTESSPNPQDFIEFDTFLSPKNVLVRTGLIVPTGYYVTCESSQDNVDVAVFGIEAGDTVPVDTIADQPPFEEFDPTIAIGTATNGGYFAGIIDTTVGNIIGADDYQTGARYALIVSPKEYEGGRGTSPAAGLPTGDLRWDAQGRIGQPGSVTRWNGLRSTNSILDKSDTDYEAYEFIRALRTLYPAPGQGSEWYIPAMDELDLLYRNFKPTATDNVVSNSAGHTFPSNPHNYGFNPSSDPTASAYTLNDPSQTAVTAFQSGESQALDGIQYWSSTDSNDGGPFGRAWSVNFTSTGNEGSTPAGPKDFASILVRPVRRVLL